MAEIIPPESPDNNPQTPPPAAPTDWRSEREQWRAQRRQWRDERRAGRGSGAGAWIGGAILIMLGLIFLVQNFTGYELQNWWALFILIPAAAAFGSAVNSYRAAGNRLNAAARGSLTGALILTVIALAFLVGYTTSIFWPVVLILVGLGLLVNVILPD